jgi:hypothetical protein
MEFTAGPQVLGQSLQRSAHHAGTDPLLKPAMAGLVGRIALGQVGPGGAGAQDVQDSVEGLAPSLPGAATPVGAALGFRNQGVQQRPLGIGQISRVVEWHLPL